MNIVLSTSDGKPIQQFDLAGQGITLFLRWIIMATVLVWMILCVSDLGKWSCSGAVKRLMPLQPATLILIARFSADSLLAIIAGSLGVWVLGDGVLSCVAIVVYVMFWSFAGQVIFIRKSSSDT